MLHVPCGDRPRVSWIERIELFTDVGTLIYRLSVGITERTLRSTPLITQGGLQGVVVGIADGSIFSIFLIELAAIDVGRTKSGWVGYVNAAGSPFLPGARALIGGARCRGERAILGKRTAARKTEAQSLITWVYRHQLHDVVTLIANITHGEQ